MVEHLKKKKKERIETPKDDDEEFVDFVPDLRDGFQPLFAFMSDPHINAHQYNLPQRAEDMLDAFREALRKCWELLGDGYIVIGGDIFNTPAVSPSTLMETAEAINDIADEMKIVVIRGNHDGTITKAERKNISLIPLQAMTNIQYIESEVYRFFPSVYHTTLILQSYMGEKTMDNLWKLSPKIKQIDRDNHKILVIHEIVEGSAPFGWHIPREEFKTFLREHDIDLVLTGHLHTKFIDEELKLLNPGSLECLDIDQADADRGFFVIGKEGNKLSHQWIPIRTRPMKDIAIDVGDVSEVDLNEVIKEQLSRMKFPKGSIVRFTVKGSTTKSLRRIDKRLFTGKFPHLLKIFVNNRIKYIREGDDVVELLSPKDAIKKALTDAGVKNSDLAYFAEAMIDISNEASNRVEGWQNEIRKIIQRQIK